MNKTRMILALMVLGLMLSACQSGKKGLYVYGDYSTTYYDMQKDPCEETRLAHLESIQDVIEQAGKYDRRVPPGMYAEYGYSLLKLNKTAEAVTYFQKEKELYPESRVLMDRLIAMASARSGEQDEPARSDAPDTEGENNAAKSDGDPEQTPQETAAAK